MKIECTDDELWNLWVKEHYQTAPKEVILPLLREVVKEFSQELVGSFFGHAESMPTMERILQIEEAAQMLEVYGIKVTR
jgi:hypothetical protein